MRENQSDFGTFTIISKNELLSTINAPEGYNYRTLTIFHPHHHIYEFVRRFKDEHEYQHHIPEEVQVQVKKN